MKFLPAIATLLIFFAAAAAANAADHSPQIQALEAQIRTLQAQLRLLQAAPKVIDTGTVTTPAMRVAGIGFTETLRRGMRGDAVRRLQELLAKYPELYPEGITSGYFGALTEQAVKRLQAKFELPAVGVVGPKTREKLNGLLLGQISIAPPAAPAPAPLPPPLPPTEPMPQPPPPPPPEPAPQPQPAPPPAPAGPIPTQSDLGFPIVSFSGWGTDFLRVQFNHDPGVHTKSYVISLKKPGDAVATKLGPYALPATIGATSSDGNRTLTRIGPASFEWQETLDLGQQPEGTYEAGVIAVGNGGVESQASPIRSSTLAAAPTFESLLYGSPIRAVINGVVPEFPLTMRLANPISGMQYRYTVLDGAAIVWESDYLTQAESSKIEARFTNANSYPFVAGTTYRIRVDAFDNSSGLPSENKVKSNEATFTRP